MGNKKIVLNTNTQHFPMREEWIRNFKALNAEYKGAIIYTEEDFIKYAKDADIIDEVLHAPMTRKVFKNLPKLKAVVKRGVGYENIDVEAAKEFGVSVSNNGGLGEDTMSAHTLLFILAHARSLIYWNNWIREGKWDSQNASYQGAPLISLRNEDIGIIGFGHLGKAIYEKLIPFGCNISIYDPFIELEGGKYKVKKVELDGLLKKSKYIILICSVNKENIHMIDEEQFKIMRKDAVLINVARGPLINEKVLIRYLTEKRIACAALDVFEQEPISPDNPLLKLDNVILTPHNAGWSPLMKDMIIKRTYEELVRLVKGEKPKYLVRELR